jgi:glycosyltransferase involved in cell wall biosynthesis
LRVPVLLQRLWESSVRGSNMYFPDGRLEFVRKYLQWQWRARFGRMVPAPSAERCTIIMLSYRRPQNMEPLVRSVLRCAFVERLIVCNNNPSYDIESWVSLADARLVLRNNSENRGTIARFDIARSENGERFLVIDDDIFLYPEQLNVLFTRLLEDPSRPHGLYGQIARPDGSFVDAVHRVDAELDVLNRVYAFTRQHLEEFYRLLSDMGIEDENARLALTRGDDMVLSFSGVGRPMCHDVGEILDCPSEGVQGIAVWRESDFRTYRAALFPQLCRLKQFT